MRNIERESMDGLLYLRTLDQDKKQKKTVWVVGSYSVNTEPDAFLIKGTKLICSRYLDEYDRKSVKS